jgi:hypothetical protein
MDQPNWIDRAAQTRLQRKRRLHAGEQHAVRTRTRTGMETDTEFPLLTNRRPAIFSIGPEDKDNTVTTRYRSESSHGNQVKVFANRMVTNSSLSSFHEQDILVAKRKANYSRNVPGSKNLEIYPPTEGEASPRFRGNKAGLTAPHFRTRIPDFYSIDKNNSILAPSSTYSFSYSEDYDEVETENINGGLYSPPIRSFGGPPKLRSVKRHSSPQPQEVVSPAASEVATFSHIDFDRMLVVVNGTGLDSKQPQYSKNTHFPWFLNRPDWLKKNPTIEQQKQQATSRRMSKLGKTRQTRREEKTSTKKNMTTLASELQEDFPVANVSQSRLRVRDNSLSSEQVSTEDILADLNAIALDATVEHNLSGRFLAREKRTPMETTKSQDEKREEEGKAEVASNDSGILTQATLEGLHVNNDEDEDEDDNDDDDDEDDEDDDNDDGSIDDGDDNTLDSYGSVDSRSDCWSAGFTSCVLSVAKAFEVVPNPSMDDCSV